MPYTTLVAGTTITASWANASVRDQAVTPFATAAARTSAVTAPVAGMFSYRTDGPLFEGYDGASWVAAARYSVYARKTANETVNNSAVLQNDDELSWAVVASGVYRLELHLIYDTGTTPDLKIGWTFPAGLTMVWGGIYADTAGAVALVSGNIQTTAQSIGGAGAAAIRGAHFWGIVTVSTAGTLQLQWAQDTANATDTIVRAGSDGLLTRI